MNPGIGGEEFILTFDRDTFFKGDILNSVDGMVKVTRVYRRTWWRRVLFFLGFNVRWFQCKVIPLAPEVIKPSALDYILKDDDVFDRIIKNEKRHRFHKMAVNTQLDACRQREGEVFEDIIRKVKDDLYKEYDNIPVKI